jgi:hypothetical protein
MLPMPRIVRPNLFGIPDGIWFPRWTDNRFDPLSETKN